MFISGLQVVDLDEEIYNNILKQNFKSGNGTSLLNSESFLKDYFVLTGFG